MRIAQVTPLYESVPPRLYGGTERIVSYLTEALVDLGHDVTLFASADAVTRAQLIPVRDQAIRLDPTALNCDFAAHLSLLHEVRRHAAEFDVIHFHVDLVHFPFFENIARSTLTTLHGRLDLKDIPGAYRRWPQFPLVSISEHQRLPLRHANWAATVPHGIPADLYRGHEAPGGYLAFLGRISPEKRPDRAIAIARAAGMRLKMAAKVDGADMAYFRTEIEPLLAKEPLVEFVGEIDDRHKEAFLGNATALLFPIDWPEPFGLVMIEAMACGTPVIAWNCGSVPEVLEEGVSGFIVGDIEEAVAAVQWLPQLDRRRVREAFERRFTAAGMARAYEGIYRSLHASGQAENLLAYGP
jgi:glycosyltransferase involved in cell wall biosynthesis